LVILEQNTPGPPPSTSFSRKKFPILTSPGHFLGFRISAIFFTEIPKIGVFRKSGFFGIFSLKLGVQECRKVAKGAVKSGVLGDFYVQFVAFLRFFGVKWPKMSKNHENHVFQKLHQKIHLLKVPRQNLAFGPVYRKSGFWGFGQGPQDREEYLTCHWHVHIMSLT